MLSLTEAITLRTANDRIAELEGQANAVIARLQQQLANEKAARLRERTAFEGSLAAAQEEIALLREIAAEAMGQA